MTSVPEKFLNKTLSRRTLVGSSAGAGLIAAAYGGVLPGVLGSAVAQDGASEIHLAWPYSDLAAGGHFNNLVTNGIFNPPNLIGDLIFAPFGYQYWDDGSWLNILGEEWGFSASTDGGDTDTFSVKIKEGVNWSDGTSVTSADAVATFNLLWLLSNTVWTYIDDVAAVDDYTFSVNIAVPSSTIERYVVRRSILPASVYGEFAGRAAELRIAGKTREDAEFTQLLDEFNNFRPEVQVGNGPYLVDAGSITSAQLILTRNESSAFAELATFDRIVNLNGETDTISAAVLAKEVDYATHGFAPATAAEFVNLGIRVIRPHTFGGGALLFNFGKFPELTDKKVRQALAKAINRDDSAFFSLAESAAATVYVAGMGDGLVDTWLSDEDKASLNTYDYDPAAAEAELLELGWTKDGDSWKKPDGSNASYVLSWPAEFADYSATGLDLVDQLNAFGFDITGQPVTFTQHPIDVDQGNFDLAIRGWGNTSNPHPRFSYETAFFTHNTLAINNGGQGTQFPLVQTTDSVGEVDLATLTRDSALGFDEDVQRANVTTIAKAFNELLNVIPLYERLGNNPALEGVRVAAWPADDDRIYKGSFYAEYIPTFLIYEGRLGPAS